jgi:hypothetical protein
MKGSFVLLLPSAQIDAIEIQSICSLCIFVCSIAQCRDINHKQCLCVLMSVASRDRRYLHRCPATRDNRLPSGGSEVRDEPSLV